MPTVPRNAPAPLQPAYDSGRGASAEAFGAGVGRASTNLGGALAGFTQQLEARRADEDAMWAEQEYNTFTTAWAFREAELYRQIQGNPQAYPDSHKMIEEEYDRMHSEFTGRVDQSRSLMTNVRTNLDTQLNRFKGKVQLGAVAIEDSRISDSASIFVRDKMNLAINEVISSPGLLQSRRLAMNTFIERNRENLGAAAEDFLLESEQKLTYASVIGQVRQAPEDALQRIHDGEFDELLSPDDKQRAIAEGYRQIDEQVRAAERAEAAARRAREEARDRRFADLLVRNARGNLTESDIVSDLENDRISPDMYRTLIRESRYEADDVGNGRLFNEIQIEMQMGGNGLELINEYREHLSVNQVSQLLSTVDQMARNGGVLARDDVQRSMRQVMDIAAGESGPMAQFDTEQIFRVQQAQNEFIARLAPDGSNHRIVMQEIASDPAYRAPDFGEGFEIEIANLPNFRRSDMDGETDVVLERIRTATSEVQEQFANGEIDERELHYRISVLNRAMQQTIARHVPSVPLVGD